MPSSPGVRTRTAGGCGRPPHGTDRWHLVVTPLPGDVPGDVRVRRWLKRGLRDFGLRCVSVGERCPDAPPGAPTSPPAADRPPEGPAARVGTPDAAAGPPGAAEADAGSGGT